MNRDTMIDYTLIIHEAGIITIEELANAAEITYSGASFALRNLERKGWINRVKIDNRDYVEVSERGMRNIKSYIILADCMDYILTGQGMEEIAIIHPHEMKFPDGRGILYGGSTQEE